MSTAKSFKFVKIALQSSVVVWYKKIGQILYADKILKNWVPNSLFECVYFQGVFILTILFASQLTLGFFGVTFHLRAQEDLRQELVLRLQKNYNVLGGEYFSPALDYIQTTVIKGKLFKEPRHKKLNNDGTFCRVVSTNYP